MSAYTDYSDQQLLQLLISHDHVAFEHLYERHWYHLYQSSFFLLRDTDASKDVVQDVFLWIWENRTALIVENVRAYLKAAVRFKVANFIRSGRIREGFFNDCARFTADPLPPTNDEIAELRELQRVIQQAIHQLPDKCREIYRLSRENGLSNREIAGRLGVSVKTVEAQMTIALKRLRTRIGYRLICLIIFDSLFM